MYDTKEEFNQKLSGCVVLYKDKPVHIIEASGGQKKIGLHFKDLRLNKIDMAPADEKDWDFRTLGSRLGYTNVDLGKDSYQESLYLTRVAVRQCSNTQGLSYRNVKIPQLRGSVRLGLLRGPLGWGSLMDKPFFLDTLERKYPSLSAVSYNMRKNSRLCSQAFDPKFAVSRPDVGPFYLDYRGKNIGYSEDFDKWKVSKDFRHLYETLEHIHLKIA